MAGRIMWLLIQRWITKAYHKGKDEGLDIGYRLGYQAGQIEAANKQYTSLSGVEPKTLVDKQIEIVVNKEGF